jgi:hypothetical protein
MYERSTGEERVNITKTIRNYNEKTSKKSRIKNMLCLKKEEL